MATDARFFCTIKNDLLNDSSAAIITVSSPQFTDPDRVFSLQNDAYGLIAGEPNAFIDNAVRYTMILCRELFGPLTKSLRVTLEADNDFYSQVDYLQKQ